MFNPRVILPECFMFVYLCMCLCLYIFFGLLFVSEKQINLSYRSAVYGVYIP